MSDDPRSPADCPTCRTTMHHTGEARVLLALTAAQMRAIREMTYDPDLRARTAIGLGLLGQPPEDT